jgi:diacylglycerol kinase (ATP)
MIHLEADGERIQGALVVISNLPQYCANLRIAPGAIANDGLLDWIVFTRPGRIRFMSYLRSVVFGRHHLRSDIRQGRAREIRLSADCPVPLQIDGEVADFTPAVIETLPAALKVLVP